MKNLFYLSILVVLFSCNQKPATPTEEELKAIVHAQNEKLKALFTEGDAEKLSQFYTKNAKLSGDGNSDVVRGREAIRDFWKSMLQGAKLVEMNTETLSIDASGDVIYETGKVTNKIQVQDSVMTFKAKYVNIWKKEDGEYKLEVDSWTDIE
ncbi:YybH family protein [Pseudochryseolinea flava]|uniref:DUF4440 domain-containing protein n=1 Tax=Pseudochryseolinea flava TaxID=2059302 RepID=A0A364Y801_9BACT|nr:nuclear transport factor 2 family protein [Pseudochryseolinea flava]RAW03211.1 hypothetical protein DQQ10_03760 [Pseudochryseolinea flava]